MGRNRDTRKKIEALQERISEHEDAISQEKEGSSPNYGFIRHWRHEIEVWEKEIKRLIRRLGRDW